MVVAFWTVLSGVFVLVIAQIFIKLVLDPIAEQKRAIGVVAYALIYYSNIYSNPGVSARTADDQASSKLRDASSQLLAATSLIPRYRIWSRIGLVLPRASIDTACSNLIGISNSTSPDHVQQIHELKKAIAEALRIPRG